MRQRSEGRRVRARGAVASVGVDISDNFIPDQPPGLEFVEADLSDLAAVPGLADRRFDRILFLQSFGYAKDPVRALKTAQNRTGAEFLRSFCLYRGDFCARNSV